MVIFKKAADLQHFIDTKRAHQSVKLGFVPTMGALHEGHLSLIEASKKQKCLTVCSIFVNPTQFNDPEDFKKYPSTLDADTEALLGAGCDILFIPDILEIYPDGFDAVKSYSFAYLETIFEGAQRPGHFQGVGKVVARLLELVQPQVLFLGQKDAQQCLVIKELIKQMNWEHKTSVSIVPTVRNEQGLALSSRNLRLTEAEQKQALALYQSLQLIKAAKTSNNFEHAKQACIALLHQNNCELEYLALADAASLQPLSDFDTHKDMMAIIAARVGAVRLIDNLFI
jgi:pantoate--beta-alanine ligase